MPAPLVAPTEFPQSVKCLSYKREDMSSMPRAYRKDLDMVAHACHLRTGEPIIELVSEEIEWHAFG